MTITLTGANGLFTRLGKQFQVIKRVVTHQTDATAGLEKEIQDAITEYSVADQHMLGNLAQQIPGIQTSAMAAVLPSIANVCSVTIIEMVKNDNPQPSNDEDTALRELIRQMKVGSATVDGNEVTTSVAADANNSGNGKVCIGEFCTTSETPLTSGYGQYIRSEDIIIECVQDAQLRGTVGREMFSVAGEPALDRNHPDWPGGSGAGFALRVTDPSEDAQSAPGRNLLTNSDFEDYTTTNAPDNWVIAVGAAGTTVFEEGTITYNGSKSLQITGDAGGTLTKLYQTLNNAGGTTGRIKPLTWYMFRFRISADTGVLDGVLNVQLEDGSSTSVGGSSANYDCTAVSDGAVFDFSADTGIFVSGATMFVTPAELPTTLRIAIKLTTALTNTKSIYIDDFTLFEVTRIGGSNSPSVNIVKGSDPFIVHDRFVATITNSHDGEIQKFMDRIVKMYERPFALPADVGGGAETIADTLIA